jgi:hypothetical protein
VLEFLFTENAGIGSPPVPGNYDSMPFLAQGSGPWYGGGPWSTPLPQGIVGQLSPWPGAQAPAPACSQTGIHAPTADAGLNQQVDSGSTVTLDGSGSADTTVEPGSLTYSWLQTSGPSVTLLNSTGVKPTFTAPLVPPGTAPVSVSFQLTVSNGSVASTATTTIDVTPGAK